MARASAFDVAKYRGNPKMIAKYLNDALATDNAGLIAKAIGDMVRAQGASRFSRKVELRRESLYRSFGGQMGPGFDTVIKVLVALDIRLLAKPIRRLVERRRGSNLMSANQRNKWTSEEDGRLKTLLEANTSIHLVAVKLKRSVAAVRSRAGLLKISSRRMRRGLKAKK
jgi:probable addiction module antidote protein